MTDSRYVDNNFFELQKSKSKFYIRL